MEKVNASYETLFVVDLTLGEDAVKALVAKFTSLIAEHGTITETNEWGKRRFAYPINDKNEGYYTQVKFTAPGDFVAELNRIYRITDGIMRSMTIKIEG